MSRVDPANDDLSTLRERVRHAMPSATPELIEEVAQHLSDDRRSARERGVGEDELDSRVASDLTAWQADGTAPSLGRRLTTGWAAEWRHAWRLAARRRTFAASALILTSIAVAAVTATFAVAYGLFWRPLPYPSSDRLAVIWQAQQGEIGQISLPDFRDLSSVNLFDASTLVSGGRGSLRVGDRIERVNLLSVEPAGFAMLGARPQLGRLLTAADSGVDVALISDRLWRTQFGSAPDIVGRPLWVSGRTFTVAGVLTPGFDFELPVAGVFILENHDLWTVLPPADARTSRREFSGFEGLVRLREGVPFAQAQAALDQVGRQLEREHGATNLGRSFRLAALGDTIVERMRQPLALGGLAAIVTLVIALANLIMLAGVRLGERECELAVRHALGAGGLRMRRQLLTEHAVLVGLGTLAGFGMARGIVWGLLANTAAHLPRPDAIRMDAPVVAVALAVCGGIVLALSCLPVRARSLPDALRKNARAGRGGRQLRHALIAAQLALALALCTGSAMLGLGLLRLHAVDPGFVAVGTATARVSAYAARYPDRTDVERFIAAAEEAARQIPGVERVAAGSSLPLSGQETGTSVVVEGRPVQPADRPAAGWSFVTPGYFETLGMPLRLGRGFADADRHRSPHVTVINETLARELFRGEDPVGRRIAFGGDDASGDWHEVIGVVSDVRHRALTEAPQPRAYDLFGQHWGRTLYLVIRAAAGTPPSMAASVRRAVETVDPEAPVFEQSTLADLVSRSVGPHRLATAIAAGLALAGLLLALTGVFAMTAVAVEERRREMGVRAALGASPRDVFWLVLREAAATVLAGGCLGVMGGLATAQLLQSRVFGLSSQDAFWVVPAAAALLTAVGVAASVPGARRAARADPLTSIRAE